MISFVHDTMDKLHASFDTLPLNISVTAVCHYNSISLGDIAIPIYISVVCIAA